MRPRQVFRCAKQLPVLNALRWSPCKEGPQGPEGTAEFIRRPVNLLDRTADRFRIGPPTFSATANGGLPPGRRPFDPATLASTPKEALPRSAAALIRAAARPLRPGQ